MEEIQIKLSFKLSNDALIKLFTVKSIILAIVTVLLCSSLSNAQQNDWENEQVFGINKLSARTTIWPSPAGAVLQIRALTIAALPDQLPSSHSITTISSSPFSPA